MPLNKLLHSFRKRSEALDDLDEVFREVFRDIDLLLSAADRDRASKLQAKMRRAIETLRTTRKDRQ
jgi:hypothetical protein